MSGPSTAFVVSISAGGIYALADIGHTGGKSSLKIMAASAVLGFVLTALDDVTGSPVGTAIAALMLFVAVLNKGSNTLVLINNLLSHLRSKS